MYKVDEIINKIIYGDNLEEMKKIPDESIDLIYLDPPFFSGRNYEIIFGDEDKHFAFKDIWKGEDGKEKRVGGIEVYKRFMRKRLVECHRVLKSTGMIFLHCDKHAAHHLRLLLDGIFGEKNFQNEIIWHYHTGGASKRKFSQKHDNIYFYSKSKAYVFNTQREPYREDKADHFTKVDSKGRKYRIREIGGKKYKYYLDKGRICHDVWEIDALNASAKERLGYPTQKPEILLERIIKAASNAGDVVLDPFCGCGTTIAVAKRLKRKFIGIDWSLIGCTLMAERIGYDISDIIGKPLTEEDFDKLDGFEWQRLACHIMGAKPNPKERGDKGIDGWFPDRTAIGVRKGSADNKFIKEFAQSIQLHQGTKNDIGVIVASKFSRNAEEVVAKLETQLGIKIIMITNDLIIDGKFDRLVRAGIGHIYHKLKKEYIWELPEKRTFIYREKKKERRANPLI